MIRKNLETNVQVNLKSLRSVPFRIRFCTNFFEYFEHKFLNISFKYFIHVGRVLKWKAEGLEGRKYI